MMLDQADDHGSQSVIVQHSSHLAVNSPTVSHYRRRMSPPTTPGMSSSPQPSPGDIFRRKSDSDILSPNMSPIGSQPHSQPISPNSHAVLNNLGEISIQSPPSSHHPLHSFGSNIREDGSVSLIPINMPLDNASPSLGLSPHQQQLIRKEHGGARMGRQSTSSQSLMNILCKICLDRSTGKHYGAYSCDGCKGFFRRSIRKKNSYSCRFVRSCSITKDQRNQCRYCRLQKCMEAGMKKEAVQNERDRITQRKTPPDGSLSMAILMNAENQCKQITSTQNPGEQRLPSDRGIATVSDVAQSVKQQLLVLVEWAKAIPCFTELNLEDRIKLLKAHSGEHLLMGTAWRSLGTDGYLLLGNDMLIPRLEPGDSMTRHGRFQSGMISSGTDINWIASRVLDDVVQPLKMNQVDEKEFMCLRTMIFFDPMLHGLEDRKGISVVRLQAQLLLEDYINERQDVEPRGRFGQMMFMLPYLQSIATAMIQQIQYAKLEGMPEIEPLIQEMLLGSLSEESDKEGYSFLPPVVTPAMINQGRQKYYCSNCDESTSGYCNASINSNTEFDQTYASGDHVPQQYPQYTKIQSPIYRSSFETTVYSNSAENHEHEFIDMDKIDEIGCKGLDLSISNKSPHPSPSHMGSKCAGLKRRFGNEFENSSDKMFAAAPADASSPRLVLSSDITKEECNVQAELPSSKTKVVTNMKEPYDLSPYSSSNYSYTSSEAASPD